MSYALDVRATQTAHSAATYARVFRVESRVDADIRRFLRELLRAQAHARDPPLREERRLYLRPAIRALEPAELRLEHETCTQQQCVA